MDQMTKVQKGIVFSSYQHFERMQILMYVLIVIIMCKYRATFRSQKYSIIF